MSFRMTLSGALNASAGCESSPQLWGRAKARSRTGSRRAGLEPGIDAETIIRTATLALPIISALGVFRSGPMARCRAPRARKKLKRAAIKRVGRRRRGARGRRPQRRSAAVADSRSSRVRGSSMAPRRLEGLGLSSLERVELMVALEDQFQTRIDETKFAGAKTLDELRAVHRIGAGGSRGRRAGGLPVMESRAGRCGSIRRLSQATWILPLGAHLRVGAGERPRASRRHRRARSCSRRIIRATSTCR